MIRPLRAAALVAAAFFAVAAHAQPWPFPPEEVKARNAAAEYVFGRTAVLGLLRAECTRFDRPSQKGIQATAFLWWERNQRDVELAHDWVNRFLEHLRSTDPAAAQRASAELAALTDRTVRENALAIFKREDPTQDACEQATRQFAASEADLRALGASAGSERYMAIAQTLGRMGLDHAYGPGGRTPHVDYNTIVVYAPVASLEAAVAAREKRDGAKSRAIYERLAAQGDGRGAEAVALMYRSGELIARDDFQAYGWFYNGFALGDYGALNGLGAQLRDGASVPANKALAYAAFSVAARFARGAQARQQARKNADALAADVAASEKLGLKCMTLAQFDAAVKQPLGGKRFGQVNPRPIVDAQRRLGEIVPRLAQDAPQACPAA